MSNTLSKGARKRLCKSTASQACATRHPLPKSLCALDFPRIKRTRYSLILTRPRKALKSKSIANARTKLAGQRKNKRSKVTHPAHDATCHKDHGSDRCLMPELPDGDSLSELEDLTPAIYEEETGAVTELGHTKASHLGKLGVQSLGSLRRSSRLAPAIPDTTPSPAEPAAVVSATTMDTMPEIPDGGLASELTNVTSKVDCDVGMQDEDEGIEDSMLPNTQVIQQPMGSPLLRPTDAILAVPIASAMSSDNGQAGESDSSAYCTAQEEIAETQPQNTISQPRTEVPNNPSTSANESDRPTRRSRNSIPVNVRVWSAEEEVACSEIMKELMLRGSWRLGRLVCFEKARLLMASRGYDRTLEAIRHRWEHFLSLLPQNLPQPEVGTGLNNRVMGYDAPITYYQDEREADSGIL